MSNHSLTVFDIQRFAIHDGPGIRTTVFLKGCPLFCPWCANPESQSPAPQLVHDRKKCSRCGRCAAVCPHGAVVLEEGTPQFRRDRCRVCGVCVENCLSDALRIAGEQRTVAEILAVVERDAGYYRRSGGGVTLSGGEPFAQYEGMRALLEACRQRGFHTAVETCGDVDPARFAGLFDLADLYLLDLKHPDAQILRRETGGNLERILRNLSAIATRDPDKVVLRMPVIPGFNDKAEVVEAVFRIALEHNVRQVRLLPYHTLGVDKYAGIGRDYALKGRPMLQKADLEPFRERGEKLGLDVRLGG